MLLNILLSDTLWMIMKSYYLIIYNKAIISFQYELMLDDVQNEIIINMLNNIDNISNFLRNKDYMITQRIEFNIILMNMISYDFIL